MTKIAIALGGTDLGASGIGVYVHSMLPHVQRRAHAGHGSLILMGTARELALYAPRVPGAECVELPALCDRPAFGALYYLACIAWRARLAGADVLLLPAGNRRATFTGGLPTLAVVHDLAQLHVRGKYDAWRMFYVCKVLVATLRRCTRLVSVSEATHRDVATWIGRDSVVIPNGVDASRFHPPAPRTGAADQRAQRPYVLYLARLEHPGKNHLRLLRAFAQSGLSDTHDLVLAGKDWGAGAAIEQEASRLGLGASLRVLGFVDDARVPDLVGGADVVAMVGLHEGFGLPALEALAAGRPVIASTTGALPEVVGELGILCDPLDCASIADALRRAVGDQVHRARVRAQGPAYARTRDWSHAATALADACLALEAA